MDSDVSDRQHIYKLLYGDIGMCGCGNPEDAYELIRRVLDLAPFHQHPESVRDLIGHDGSYHLVLSLLTNAGLIEHGGGIGGSWLTGKGKHYRELLRRYEWDAIEADGGGVISEIGYPHDGKPCDSGCRHLRASA
jgi:hypothetical protein